MTVARRVIGATSSATGFPIVPKPAEASKPRLRERILVGGKDVTFFRDVPTPAPDTRRIMPLSFGDGGVLTFPQTSMYGDDVPGTDDLWWLRYGKKVVIQLVDDDTNAVVIPDYWIGYVSLPPYPNSDGNWCVDLSGDAAGRLSTIKVPGPRFSKNRDVLIRCANDLTTVGRPVEPRFPYSGIEVASRGGMSGLDHFNEHIVLAQTNTGVQWTCRWSTLQQAYVFAQKDLETITATVYLDGALVTPSLMPGAPVNRVWSTGVNDRGERITHVAAPGIIQGTAPEFPGTLEEGDDNEDVTVLLWQLTFTGYLDLDDHPGGFDQDVVDAVEELQEDAGLTVTGIVNSATWDALFDLTSTQKGINFIHERPAASSPSVEKFNRSASGAILGLNPDYDPDHIKSDADFDMGRANRRKIKRWSKNELVSPSEVHWSGLLTFNVGQDGVGSGGLLYGEDDGESTLTAADVMDPRELVEGDVLLVPRTSWAAPSSPSSAWTGAATVSWRCSSTPAARTPGRRGRTTPGTSTPSTTRPAPGTAAPASPRSRTTPRSSGSTSAGSSPRTFPSRADGLSPSRSSRAKRAPSPVSGRHSAMTASSPSRSPANPATPPAGTTSSPTRSPTPVKTSPGMSRTPCATSWRRRVWCTRPAPSTSRAATGTPATPATTV